ncbi:hypothetical protein, conserved [Eimeria tenella]|uniref:Uncharacterized protein n=1 Tax=Eimeria tenella TaxID=5802 RepID=U6L2L9_EIMTE|nr:hypothetical protein, conserved [Eimeria tenella]CDJ42010.1 hypothetical protein, conserved [Eimeria tenella]|eukprot:XP_013232760.1 hypothetical protein, conserved [Eimeria tenella]
MQLDPDQGSEWVTGSRKIDRRKRVLGSCAVSPPSACSLEGRSKPLSSLVTTKLACNKYGLSCRRETAEAVLRRARRRSMAATFTCDFDGAFSTKSFADVPVLTLPTGLRVVRPRVPEG